MGGFLNNMGGSMAQHFKGAGGVQGLLENPMFNVGMGLLQANNAQYGQNQNPFTAALGGLQQTQRMRDMGDEREALQKARERQDELYERLQELYGNPTGQQPQPGQPQMSPVPQAPDVLSQLGITPGMGVPGQTPGINPNAPPIMGQQSPFGQALGTSAGGAVSGAAPSASEVQALMLQYGSPAQQQAALSQMSANERFTQGLAAEEARYQRRISDPTGRIGTYNPRDYTTESWGEFITTKDPTVLQRYERTREVDLGGGRIGLYDPVTQRVTETTPQGQFEEGITGASQARAQGTAQGTAITAAQQQLAGLESMETELLNMFADPNFSQAVGPVDAVTGRIGEWFGSDEGVLGGSVQRMSNRLVTQAVEAWKGAISERELDFFRDSVPGRASSPETWRRWFETEYLPRKRLAERVASGEVFHDDRLVGGSSETANFQNLVDQDTADALAQYGVQGNP